MECVAKFTNRIPYLQERSFRYSLEKYRWTSEPVLMWQQRAEPLPRKEIEPKMYTNFKMPELPRPIQHRFLTTFSVYNPFPPSKQCICFATSYQTTWSKILPERPMIIAQLARNSLHLMHPRLFTVLTKVSHCNRYYEPRECNSYASIQGAVKKKKNCHTYAVLMLKMFTCYLKWT